MSNAIKDHTKGSIQNFRINGDRLWDSIMDMAKIGPGIAGGNNRQTLTDEDSDWSHEKLLARFETCGMGKCWMLLSDYKRSVCMQAFVGDRSGDFTVAVFARLTKGGKAESMNLG